MERDPRKLGEGPRVARSVMNSGRREEGAMVVTGVRRRTLGCVGILLAFASLLAMLGPAAWAGTWLVVDTSSNIQGVGNGVYYITSPVSGWCTISGSGAPGVTSTWVWKNANWYAVVPGGDSAQFSRTFSIPSGATIITAQLRYRVDNFGWIRINGTTIHTYDWGTGCPDTGCGADALVLRCTSGADTLVRRPQQSGGGC